MHIKGNCRTRHPMVHSPLLLKLSANHESSHQQNVFPVTIHQYKVPFSHPTRPPSDPHYFVGQTSVGSTPQHLLRQLTALSSSDQKRNEVSTSSIASSYTRPFITCDQPTSSTSLPSHSNGVDNIASRWWEVEAQRIVETSQDFGEI
jgi:hypothetical protein